MNSVIKGCKVYQNGNFVFTDFFVNRGRVSNSTPLVSNLSFLPNEFFNNCYIFPGFVDVHVHLREPGFFYKAKISTETIAAAKGGYTDICSMPNLKPVPDNANHLKVQTDIIKSDAVINVYPYGAITVGQNGEELSAMEEITENVIAFSDDGKGIQSIDLMEKAMIKAKQLDKIIVAHCEDNSLLGGGYIHDGVYAQNHSHKGICSKSEYGPIARDIELVRKTGCKYHVCHISCKESVDLIRKAKKDGLDITCETAPHYLILDENNLQENGRFKMNPPLRSKEDRIALIEGIKDGTIDMIATDHAPHAPNEKDKGLEKSAFGVVGIETAFSLLYTNLVENGVISLEKLIELMSINPSKRFKIPSGYENGSFTVFDLDKEYIINSKDFLSMGKATPFEGFKVKGECKMTVCKGEVVWKKD